VNVIVLSGILTGVKMTLNKLTLDVIVMLHCHFAECHSASERHNSTQGKKDIQKYDGLMYVLLVSK